MSLLTQFAAIISSDYLPKNNQADVANIFTIVLTIFGAIAVLIVVYSGIQLIISQGNSEKVAQARRGIIYAIVGLIVVLFAQVLVTFIFKEVQ